MISSLVAFLGSWSRPPILTENIAAGSPCRGVGVATVASTSNSSFESIFGAAARSGDRDRVEEESESDIFWGFFLKNEKNNFFKIIF